MVYFPLLILELVILFLLSRRLGSKIYHLFFSITKSKRIASYLFSLIFAPGTFLHEISHFLCALLLFVPVGQIEIIPETKDDGIKLGSIPVGKTGPIRRFLIGSAPLLVGMMSIFAIVYYVSEIRIVNTAVTYTIAGYLAFTVGNTMFLSKKDLEGLWKAIVILAILTVGVYLTDFDKLASLDNQFLSGLLRKASLFLIVPIIIDTVVIYLLTLLATKRK